MSLSGTERDEVRVLGPLTQKTLDDYAAKKKAKEAAGDPAEKLSKLVAKLSIGKSGKNKGQFNKKALDELNSFVDGLLADTATNDEMKVKATSVRTILADGTSAEEQLVSLKALLPAGNEEAVDDTATQAESSGPEEESK